MSEVTVYLASDLHPSEHVVLQPDFDSCEFDLNHAQSELAALREENRLLNHDIASFLETTARVCELLGIDTNDARHAEGKPSDVLFSHATALQQRLADAERRYRGLQKLTPYKFRKIQDASTTDGIDILYFHADRFDALLDAAITKPEEAKS